MTKDVYTDLMIELGKELKKIWDDRDFILSVMADVWYSPEDQRVLLDFIRKGDDVDVETITVLALELGDAREASNKHI